MGLSQIDANTIIAVMDQRIDANTASGANVEYTYGIVQANDGQHASVFLYGESDPSKVSTGFELPNGIYPAVGDAVRVGMDVVRGSRWIDGVYPATDYPKIAWDQTGGRFLVGNGTVAPAGQGALSPFALTLLDDLTAAAALATIGAQAAGSYQPLDTDLTAIAALVSAADKMPYSTGSGTWSLAALTSAARSLLDDPDAATMRSTLGLAIGTNVQAYNANLAAVAGLVSAADNAPYFTGSGTASLMAVTAAARSILDDADIPTIRTTLGLGTGYAEAALVNALNITPAKVTATDVVTSTKGIKFPYAPTQYVCSSSLTCTTSFQDIAGCTTGAFTPSVAEYALVTAVVNVTSGSATGASFHCELMVDGVLVATPELAWAVAATGYMNTLSGFWIIPLSSGVSHTIKLQAKYTTAVFTVNSASTTLTVLRLAQ